MMKTVRFGNDESSAPTIEMVGPLLVPSSEMSCEEKEAVWWQQHDYDSFCANLRVLAVESRRRDMINGKSDPACYSAVIHRAYTACVGYDAKGPSRKERSRLAQWTILANTRRGLERGCVRQIGIYRSEQKKEAIQGVLRAQRKLRRSQQDKADILCMVSESLTRSARLYAALLGEADAFAALIDVQGRCWKPSKEIAVDSARLNAFASSSLLGRPRLLRRASCSAMVRICSRGKQIVVLP